MDVDCEALQCSACPLPAATAAAVVLLGLCVNLLLYRGQLCAMCTQEALRTLPNDEHRLPHLPVQPTGQPRRNPPRPQPCHPATKPASVQVQHPLPSTDSSLVLASSLHHAASNPSSPSDVSSKPHTRHLLPPTPSPRQQHSLHLLPATSKIFLYNAVEVQQPSN